LFSALGVAGLQSYAGTLTWGTSNNFIAVSRLAIGTTQSFVLDLNTVTYTYPYHQKT